MTVCLRTSSVRAAAVYGVCALPRQHDGCSCQGWRGSRGGSSHVSPLELCGVCHHTMDMHIRPVMEMGLEDLDR